MIRGELASEPTLSPEIPQPVEVISLPAEAQSAVSQAIESYLSIQNALYSDQLAGVAPSARRMAEQLQRAAETAPAEKPHFWHQMPEFKILQTKLGDLASATDLKSARVAFGYVGEAFDGLLKTTGVPASPLRHVQRRARRRHLVAGRQGGEKSLLRLGVRGDEELLLGAVVVSRGRAAE